MLSGRYDDERMVERVSAFIWWGIAERAQAENNRSMLEYALMEIAEGDKDLYKEMMENMLPC